jgi:hypothetical protein
MATIPTIHLSKSKFVAGVQCLKRLYLQIHQPVLAAEADPEQEARLEEGQEVGILARSAFPGGVLVDVHLDQMDDALVETAALMRDPSVPAIFEAAFRHKGVLVRVDILQRRPRNRWSLIEVKSAVECKEHYLYDVAIQYYVLSGCGIGVSSVCVMHLNRDYVYDGKKHDLSQLFAIKNLKRQVAKVGIDFPKLLEVQQRVIAQDHAPDISPGPQCLQPYQCEFFDHCNPPVPEHHISFLPRLSEKKKQELVASGFTQIPQIPDGFPLTETQRRVCAAVRTGSPWFGGSLKKELSRLKYPLYFMDFESLYPAVPRYAGMWPYSQIPFQWSVHRHEAPNGGLEHFEFLAEDEQDPRRDFVDSLCAALGRRGHIVVYNQGFESQRLSELARWLPDYKSRISRIHDRLWDLLLLVRNGVYHPEFQGSFSLKSVLPALVPDLTYEGMEIANGENAGLAWASMVRGTVGAAERERLHNALLAYCRKDTLALAKLVARLQFGFSGQEPSLQRRGLTGKRTSS